MPKVLFIITSLIKEALGVSIFAFILLKRKMKTNKKILIYQMILIYFIVISSFFSLFNKIDLKDNFVAMYNYVLLPIYVYIYWHYDYMTNQKYIILYKIYIYGNLLLFLFSFVAYIFKFPFFYYSYANRISIGNPSVTSFSYLICFFSFIYYEDIFNYSKYVRLIIKLLFLIAILLTISSTAIFSLGFISFILIFLKHRNKIIKSYKKLILFFILLGIGITYFYNKEILGIFDYFMLRLDDLIRLIKIKLKIEKTYLLTKSYSIRENQFSNLLIGIKRSGLIYYIFGLGGANYLNYTKYLENQYYAMLGNYGVVGLFLYIFLLIRNFKFYVYAKNRDNIVLIILTLLMIFYSITLEVMTLYSVVGSYALFFSISRKGVLSNENSN
jgi:O-antigen ligase